MGSGSKSRNKSPAKPKPKDPERVRRFRRAALHTSLVIAIIAGGALGLQRLKHYVEKIEQPTSSMTIVIKNRPRWMTTPVIDDLVARTRPTGPYSVFDRELLVKVRKSLEADPWVEHVNRVRRAYSNEPGDTIEIDCDFRVPAALVRWGNYYWLVDRKGIKLPEQFTAAKTPGEVLGRDGRINLRIIDGVRKPPPEAGHQWPGDDLAAGLEMAAVLFNRPFTEDIVKIDVSNIGGRDHADASQIKLVTRYGTSIFWGRSPADPDAFIEIRPDRKLETLSEIYSRFGRVDMRQPWIDIRFDGVRYSAPSPSASAQLDLRH